MRPAARIPLCEMGVLTGCGERRGTVVVGVTPGSPAAEASQLQLGDAVVEVNGSSTGAMSFPEARAGRGGGWGR